MRNLAAAAAVLVGITGIGAGAGTAQAAPAERLSFDIAGETLATCPTGSYEVLEGTVEIVVHAGEAASGNTNFTATERPVGVVVENDQGQRFRVVGANWFGGTYNAATDTFRATATHKWSIVGPGGVVESFNMVEVVRGEDETVKLLGSCRWP